MISFDLSGKVAVVTGASSGLGEQFAKALANQGANLVLLARRKERLDKLAAELEELGVKCLPISCDVTDEKAIKQAIEQALTTFSKIDILVNNAGIAEFSLDLESHTTEQWEKVLNTDLKAVFLLSREVGKQMKQQKSGKIINIASVGSFQAGPGQVSYYAAKSGVVGLTKALAAELAPFNVTVNAIAPGVFPTEINQDILDTEAAAAYRNRTVFKRFGHSGEIDGALIYFASEASSYTTAQILTVDGGLTAML